MLTNGSTTVGSNYVNTVFSDAGAAISTGTAPYTGTFRPVTPFSGLGGRNPNGTWRLECFHFGGAFQSIITDWSLTFNFEELEWSGPGGFSSTLPTPRYCLPTQVRIPTK
jgi:hypothetical protein